MKFRVFVSWISHTSCLLYLISCALHNDAFWQDLVRWYFLNHHTEGLILYLVFCHCHSHNAYQQCLPSSSAQSCRLNIAKALWLLTISLWREKQDTCTLLKIWFEWPVLESNSKHMMEVFMMGKAPCSCILQAPTRSWYQPKHFDLIWSLQSN